jgi:hypothetical protein
MQSNIEFLKPRDFGEIINDTFIFIRQNFKPLMKYFFIFCGFFLLASTAMSVLEQIKIMKNINNLNADNYNQSNPYSAFSFMDPGYFLTLFFLWLEYTAMTVTFLCYITLYKQNGNTVPNTDEMWGYFKFYFLKILGSSLVITILIIAGLVFCLIPGIYLAIIFALIPPIMIIENTSFGYAFNQSFRLIKDNWWVTFGSLVVIYIVLYVASMIVVIPATILNAGSIFMHFTKGTTVSITATVIATVLQQIAHIFHVLPIVAVSLCYFNLTESKEGTGLIERINQLGKINPDSNIAPEEY